MFRLQPGLSLKRKFTFWRAHLSIPTLLARYSESRIISIVTAINAGLAIALISFLAWALNLPLMFPALGPCAFLQFSRPFSPAAAPRSVVLGHFSAIVVGFASWKLISWLSGVQVTIDMGGWPTIVSASLALSMSCAVLIKLSCPHAPACATALIVALGVAESWLNLLGMAVGVVLLTLQAGLILRMAGLNVPVWAPGQAYGRQE